MKQQFSNALIPFSSFPVSVKRLKCSCRKTFSFSVNPNPHRFFQATFPLTGKKPLENDQFFQQIHFQQALPEYGEWSVLIRLKPRPTPLEMFQDALLIS